MPASQTTPLRPVRHRKPASNPGMVAPSPDSRRRITIDSTPSVIIQSTSSKKRLVSELNKTNDNASDAAKHCKEPTPLEDKPAQSSSAEVCISILGVRQISQNWASYNSFYCLTWAATKNVTKTILQADSDNEGRSGPKRRKADDGETDRLKAYYHTPVYETGDVSISLFICLLSLLSIMSFFSTF